MLLMLAVSPLRRTKDEIENQGEMDGFSIIGGTGDGDFEEFSDGNLLESINFDDLFVGINVAGAVLPDLEMDPEILAEFSVESSENMNSSSVSMQKNDDGADHQINITTTTNKEKEEEEEDEEEDFNNKVISSGSGSNSGSSQGGGEEIVSKRDETATTLEPSPKEGDKGRKSSAQSKNSQGKRKTKVDWTPELHRRFVQAVEQLGVDKAVPSRILEVMGIGCLTRHNIASHLQKYRSHRKHLLAREAEAARWSKRREMYGGGGGEKRTEVRSPWVAPTLGFPQMAAPMHHFRPLHVWGHPTMDLCMPMWPKHHHLPHPLLPPPPAWPGATTPPPPDPSFSWHTHLLQADSNALTAGTGTHCFLQPLTTTRLGSPPVPGIPPHAMFKVDSGIGVPAGPLGHHPWPVFDFLPSKESIDAAIGDVLSKPWLPLPLGLKAPALDSVLGELQRQGIAKIPPSCA